MNTQPTKQELARLNNLHKIFDLIFTLSRKYPDRSLINIIYDAKQFSTNVKGMVFTNEEILNSLQKYYKLKD